MSIFTVHIIAKFNRSIIVECAGCRRSSQKSTESFAYEVLEQSKTIINKFTNTTIDANHWPNIKNGKSIDSGLSRRPTTTSSGIF